MKNLKFAIIRKDILKRGESVPVGNGYYGERVPLEYRYKGKKFQVRVNGKFQEAQNIDFDFIEIKILIQPESKNRKDSFWYYDQTIASLTIDGRTFYAQASGEIRVFFTPNGEIFRNAMAVKEAKSFGFGDKKLNSLNNHDGWQNNNWFTVFEEKADGTTNYFGDVSYDYDEAIYMLLGAALEETE